MAGRTAGKEVGSFSRGGVAELASCPPAAGSAASAATRRSMPAKSMVSVVDFPVDGFLDWTIGENGSPSSGRTMTLPRKSGRFLSKRARNSSPSIMPTVIPTITRAGAPLLARSRATSGDSSKTIRMPGRAKRASSGSSAMRCLVDSARSTRLVCATAFSATGARLLGIERGRLDARGSLDAPAAGMSGRLMRCGERFSAIVNVYHSNWHLSVSIPIPNAVGLGSAARLVR